ncbi:MAG: sensor domain-containing diguanylate cyclase [Candidatus Omnitrophica bacterium]|nr:sensor domain-containing diguanylate cyclase [Candidatus Omnitrophota bacterium]MDD5671927.1 sensor domain-containing diguanylate cyclase [Candidatus Omnitrophota bacterium]
MMRLTRAQKQIIFVCSLLFAFFLFYQVIHSLSLLPNTVIPEVYLGHVAIALTGFFLVIFGGWLSFSLVGGVVFSLFAAVMVIFAATLSKASVFAWFLIEYGILCLVLFRLDEFFENRIADFDVEREKYQNEKNDLEISYKAKGEGISIYFEKYSTYYHLRKLAEELVTSLSVHQVSTMVVERCLEFIPRGDIVLMAIADTDGHSFSVVASKGREGSAEVKSKQGDLFDFWVIRNRKRLIVNDAHQDFRFDIKQTARNEFLRSLVVVPLLNEGRVVGTLRINAAQREIFSNEDLRLLDALGTLGSSALSNAMLFEKTEELAIRDSLTGLYVRRYFFDRLKQEHRRFLLTQRPLSLLMCDLDYFKECNDRHGHQAGDLMLVRVAEILKSSTEGALVSRYGGEEFAILLTETSKEDAAVIAERIRQNVENNVFAVRREKISMTVSVGVANLPLDTLDIETLVRKSDHALYQAKREGRNRICLSKS